MFVVHLYYHRTRGTDWRELQRNVTVRRLATAAPAAVVHDADSNPTPTPIPEGVTEEMIDSTVLTPAAGQTVVATETGRHGHGHHEADNMRPGRVWEMGRDFASVEKSICGTNEEVLRSATATVVGFKEGQAMAYQIEGRQQLATENSRNLLSVQADKNYYQLSLEAVKNASAAELTARTLAAAAAAQLAECCCELKMAVTAEGVATRALIEDNEKVRLNARINELQIANAAFYTRNVPPTSPTVAGA